MKKKNNKLVKIFAVLLAICIIGAASGYFWINSWGAAYNEKDTTTKVVEIPTGSSPGDIGAILEKEGIIASGTKFKYFSKIKGFDSKFLAGNYSVSPSMTMEEICNIIASGKISSSTFTIPEGYNIKQIGKALEDNGYVTQKEFLDAATNETFEYDFLKDAVAGENHLEGYLYPDTYEIPSGANAKDIIKIFLDNFQLKFKKEFYAKAEKQGKTINEIMTIASIIEREARKENERKTISSVIYNRLEAGMPLQMCSTIQYLLGSQKEMLSYDDLAIESPYNTYKNQGLPPGPIGAPGIKSIEAALNPEKTNYLYFVVSPKLDGSHNFSSDYEKFEKDKEAYNKAYEEQYNK